MELGWAAAIQAVLVALSTWYVRNGSKKDAQKVVNGTASQSTSIEIREQVIALQLDVAILKKAVLEASSVDHRGPTKPQGGGDL